MLGKNRNLSLVAPVLIGVFTCSHKISEYDGVVGAIARVSPDRGVSATSMTARLAPESPGHFRLPKE